MIEQTARVDLHLHSEASNTTDYFAANALSLPESYSDPFDLYRLLRTRGMSLVTLTDHNSIDGVLKLLDTGLTDVFISAEMTTTFPEDGCNIHVTVVNVTEQQFAEVNRLRRNVYDMLDYLDGEIAQEAQRPDCNRIAYFMTHPLMSTQNRPYGRDGSLRLWHIEKALLLFPALEIRNGSRTRALNDLTADIIARLDPALVAQLSARHDLAPRGERPWCKAVLGGSDDHAGINPGRTWTEFDTSGGPPSANSLVDAIRRRDTRVGGAHGGPITLAHAVLKLLHDGSQRKHKASTALPSLGGPIEYLLRLVFDTETQPLTERLRFQLKAWYRQAFDAGPDHRRATRTFEAVLGSIIHALLADTRFRTELGALSTTDDRIFLVVKTLINRLFEYYFERLRQLGERNLIGFVRETVALLASNLFVSLPYLASYLQQSSDCAIARDARSNFDLASARRIVLITDTFFDVNGVSATIRRMIREAIRRNIDFTVVTCLEPGRLQAYVGADTEIADFVATGRLVVFDAVTSLDFPQYDGLRIHFPPFLDLLRWLQESGCTKIHISTPGTIGLAGLAAAKLLQIETAATYHTSIPEYVENYTRDVSLEALAWKYMIVFYHAVDEVLVPSRFIARLLHERGLRKRKLLILDRWIDVGRFHPGLRDAAYWARFGDTAGAAVTRFAYVGRVAVEKDLHLVAMAYRRLREIRSDAHLVIIGDGPYRAELEQLLDGLPVTFTGFLDGDELPRAIASADVKLFPSTTDTWGNAPLEAQACGLPVIVSDVGGPAELMLDGVTGYCIPGHDADALYTAMVRLLDPALRQHMGTQARLFTVANRLDEPFSTVFDADGYRRRERARKARQRADRQAGMAMSTRLPRPDGGVVPRDAGT